MARTASQAIAGFYKTPEEQIPRIARLLHFEEPRDDRQIAVMDPCAGEGEAITQLAQLVTPPWTDDRADDVATDGTYAKSSYTYNHECDATHHWGEDGCPRPACSKFVLPETRIPARLKRLQEKYEESIAKFEWASLYTCELEESRHEALRERLQAARSHHDVERALHGDAFQAAFRRVDSDDGIDLLFLNPPYDQDIAGGSGARTEQKFLERFAPAITVGGVLVFVVPYYVLGACADTIARMFERVTCYRFAGEDAFAVYKQVVLFARRRAVDLREPDAAIMDTVRGWAELPPLDELPDPGADVPDELIYDIPTRRDSERALIDWKMHTIDAQALTAKFRPWHESTRRRGLAPLTRILPDLPLAQLMHRTFDVATPPRPAHIAAGIAAGLFNGQRIDPDDPKTDLPPLLVKGVFDREWRSVEEKKNKHGETTSVVQVQQPKLVVSVLDLRAHLYHTLAPSLEKSAGAPKDVTKMGIADLLTYYGRALMGVMERQCRILFDPRRLADATMELASVARPPFTAQAHAARACVKILQEKPGWIPLLSGEIGVGKSGVALHVAKTFNRAKRILITAPPHLMDGWTNEIAAVMPEAEVRILRTVSDVDALAEVDPEQRVVAVLSRETAKLGHAWDAVTHACPRCGAALPRGVDLAKKRTRCAAKTYRPTDHIARLAQRLALALRPYAFDNPYVIEILHGRLDKLRAEALHARADQKDAPTPPVWRMPAALGREIRAAVTNLFIGEDASCPHTLALWTFVAAPDDEALAAFIPLAHVVDTYEHFAEKLSVALLPHARAEAIAQALPDDTYSHGSTPREASGRLDGYLAALRGKGDEAEDGRLAIERVSFGIQKGQIVADGCLIGSVGAALTLLPLLAKLGAWRVSPPCGEPLYQAIPEPRRYPLAKYIVRRYPRLFDFMVADEIHEASSADAAQTIAVHRLLGLKLPALMMTGTFLNGYAASAFTNMRATSPTFREEFGRGDENEFTIRYGYKKRVLADKVDGEVVAFGSHTDRVERSERDAGDAPGVLPLFLFRHLLPVAVTLQKEDLRMDLPAHAQTPQAVTADTVLFNEYRRLLETLKHQIKSDQFAPGRAGKLFGALSELPSFLDRATEDVGNVEGGGAYEIRYPENVPEVGGDLVASARLLPASTVLPKEQIMLDTIERELAEGRRVMVLGWHLGLLPRLQRLIEKRIGEPAPILHAAKVPTAKRQAWIDREIVKKHRRVMIANPVCVSTGLNNLVHFHTQWWHENPACNPHVYRQTCGRIDRIGKAAKSRSLIPRYEGTLQAQMYDLLMAKVAVATAVDGLDNEAALRAAGVVEDTALMGLSIGKELWRMIEKDIDELAAAPAAVRPVLRVVAGGRR